MSENLQLFDLESRMFERWPAQMWTKLVITGNNPQGQRQRLSLLVSWVPEAAYALPSPTGYVPSPISASALTAACLSQAAKAGAADLLGPINVEMFDGYYYDAATHVVSTYQQDKAALLGRMPELAALLNNQPPAPAAPVTV